MDAGFSPELAGIKENLQTQGRRGAQGDSTTMIKMNGHSMADPLKTVLVCPPENAGWNDGERVSRWRELNFLHAPELAIAQGQHRELRRQLKASGTEIIELPPQ